MVSAWDMGCDDLESRRDDQNYYFTVMQHDIRAGNHIRRNKIPGKTPGIDIGRLKLLEKM